MQSAYISRLLELAEKDNRICHLLADSGTNYDEVFRRNFPERMFNFGITEQNTIGIAAGMASGGKIPFVFLQGSFITYRAMEFVRDDVCFQNVNVKLTGQGSGISWSGLGPSHQTTEDIAVLRVLPNIHIFSPATPLQVKFCLDQMYEIKGPCYMRIGMNGEKEYFDDHYSMPESGQDILSSGDDILIFSTGSILEEVIDALPLLSHAGIKASVVNVVRIKPFNEDIILSYLGKVKKIFSVEEHQITGGLGSIICEVLASRGIGGLPVCRIGFNDTFARGYAPSQKELRIENQLDAASLAKRIMDEFYK